jgi:hypothetical protein
VTFEPLYAPREVASTAREGVMVPAPSGLLRVVLALERAGSAMLGALARRAVRAGSDRGDVPGWVMVTVMTAGLVAAVFAVFRDAIVTAVQDALAQVVSDTGS